MTIKKLIALGILSVSLNFHAQHAVSRIYSDFGGFWDSSSTVQPNNSHNLLAFRWDADGAGTAFSAVTYSTGVNNGALNTAGVIFQPGTFISLPIYNIPAPGNSTFIGVGQLFGGNGNASPIPVTNNLTEYLSDGINGLGLGSAIFNIPQGSSISLNTMGIVPASIGDGVPDLIFTQMGAPSGANDTYHFEDVSGNMIGSVYSVAFNSVQSIGKACWKFYNANTNPPSYNAGVSSGCERDVRVLAADWSEFGITTANYGQAVKLIQAFSGTSDLAFIGAYNKESITFAASITGSVFNDNNAGVPDGNGMSGVTVKLFSNNSEIRSTVTNTAGFYFFDNINTNTHQGPYRVDITVPSGFTVVGNSSGSAVNSLNVSLSNSTSTGNNFGINQPPVAGNDNISVAKNTSKSHNITTNDSDPNSGSLVLSSINLIPPSNASSVTSSNGLVKGFSITGQGTWNVDNLGVLTFSPAMNFFNTASSVNYTIRDQAGLTSNAATVNIAVDYCTKPGIGGVPDGYADIGISTLSGRYKTWPKGPGIADGGVPNGFLALDSPTSGMVITRVANSAAVTSPVKGMLIYDREAQCIKLYNGSTWHCIKRTCND
ncbi:Ig-like domain-containing protein [Chryseobacterium sp. JJR-5R]|uniref:Ig-like domain-containing protein n=1 Tax=Chryseobacterium sp. JJR-5R TaxID=3093923 RepID=UPI002A747965|nr:SdrD B-like domain-containing protein [Chryseobacterium sp. JJR-5R]WPO81566.1 Ig-like domain-containing protein [Chryseobacterium sp. JJR-5R]